MGSSGDIHKHSTEMRHISKYSSSYGSKMKKVRTAFIEPKRKSKMDKNIWTEANYVNSLCSAISNALWLSTGEMKINQISMFAVYDLLVSWDCLPDLLQGGLKDKNVNDVFILATFQVQNKTPVRLFRIYNPTDNTDHFDFSIHGKLNKGTFAV